MIEKIYSPRRHRGTEIFFSAPEFIPIFLSGRLCGLLISVSLCLCGLIFSAQAQPEEISLNQNWQFRKAGDTIWYPATIPGTVHTDLLANKLIPDPFYRDNESKVQWVENEDWEYQTFFDCDSDLLQQKHLELRFDGLDTYADVYLNDSLILRADNMFRFWNMDVKKILRAKNNYLFIHFYSSVKKGKELAAQLNYKLPGDEGGKALERKAQYQFGWDWGPRLVTCGVWKDIKLTSWNYFKIKELYALPTFITDSISKVHVKATLIKDGCSKVRIEAMNYSSANSIHYPNDATDLFYSNVLFDSIQNVSIESSYDFDFKIEKSHISGSNRLRESPLYNLYMSYNVDTTLPKLLEMDEFDPYSGGSLISYGLTRVNLVQMKDSFGSSFYFQLNGQPLFIKGANIIPPDNFLPRVTIEEYKRLVDDAVACHMNMLRIWGGGAYLPDEFYDYCDEKGILIWQDFMFAGAMVPGDSAFVENVKQEAIEQVIRLRNHPCIALWCGNNEINEAWNNWGFQDLNPSTSSGQSHAVNEKIWNDYKRIFDTILPQVVHEYDPGSFYWESSPSIGWGHKEAFQQGDSHYWGVWWGGEPFSSYEEHVGRFMSEYGFQSLPSMDCFYEFATPDDWKEIPLDKKKASNVLNAHQKHPKGYEIINEYMQRDYKVPKDFEKYVYVSQLQQRDGMAVAIEAHRRAKPYCMGTLYWQLNDCWPVTSWSSVDYTGTWKALQYSLKRDLYNAFLISMKDENDSVRVYVVSDSSKDFNARMRIQLLSFDGKEKISLLDSIVHLAANSSTLLFNVRPYRFSKPVRSSGHWKERFFLHAELSQDEEIFATKNFYFSKPKDLTLPQPYLQSEIHFSRIQTPYKDYPSVYTISLHTNAFAKDVFLSYDFEDVKFSDNFFDMLPGEDKTILMYGRNPIDQVNMPLKILTLNDLMKE